MGKQDTGVVDALKQTKTEIDAEGKFKFDYVCSEDDLMVNKEIFDHENSNKSNISLKGNLRRNIAYWQNTLMANKSILHIIENGYKIPFFETPEKANLPNNKSSLKEEKFVLESISEMVKIGSIKEVIAPPKVINPVSVSENSTGQKRLILDLRYINEHLYKEKIKFDDWKCFENYLEHTDGYVFKFDLKSGYHHVDVFEEHQTYLGFSWKIDNIVKFFVFTVLPFGLSTAPFVFTKVVRPLVKYWRFNSIKIACFLDDGLGIGNTFERALEDSTFVLNSLTKAGFIINSEKSVWQPTKVLTWLGIEVDLNNDTLKVSSERIDSILFTIEFILSKSYVSARTLSKLTGKLISTKCIIGNIVQLKTRALYKVIEKRLSWDKKFNIGNYNDTVEEILYWKFNIRNLNNKVFREYRIPSLFVYSDASNNGLASVYKDRGKSFICHKNFDKTEKKQSSTWRELEALHYSLKSSKGRFKNETVYWYTDNFASSLIVSKGSNKEKLQKLALNIFEITSTFNIKLSVFWIPRKNNRQADALSKNMDNDDWVTTSNLIDIIERRWGNITIDRFASDKNRKSKRFNSRYLCPETEGVNAFSLDWSNEFNLLVPPVYLISKTIHHFLASSSKARAVLVCPRWPSATFWPLLHKKVNEFYEFVDDSFTIKDMTNYIKLGENENSLIGSKNFKREFLVLLLRTG